MTKILNRENELLEELKFNNIAEYSSLLKALPAVQVRIIINSGISEIRRFNIDPNRKLGFDRKA